jgi:D-tyrosyl-tRNA(Tyr) deacylase
MCGGSGVHPEEPPFCPECGSQETEWYADQTEPVKAAIVDMIGEVAGCDDFNIVYCNDCGEASR